MWDLHPRPLGYEPSALLLRQSALLPVFPGCIASLLQAQSNEQQSSFRERPGALVDTTRIELVSAAVHFGFQQRQNPLRTRVSGLVYSVLVATLSLSD